MSLHTHIHPHPVSFIISSHYSNYTSTQLPPPQCYASPFHCLTFPPLPTYTIPVLLLSLFSPFPLLPPLSTIPSLYSCHQLDLHSYIIDHWCHVTLLSIFNHCYHIVNSTPPPSLTTNHSPSSSLCHGYANTVMSSIFTITAILILFHYHSQPPHFYSTMVSPLIFIPLPWLHHQPLTTITTHSHHSLTHTIIVSHSP